MSGRKAKEERRKGERLSPVAKAAERAFARVVAEHLRTHEDLAEIQWRHGHERRKRIAATVGLVLFVAAMILLGLTVVIG